MMFYLYIALFPFLVLGHPSFQAAQETRDQFDDRILSIIMDYNNTREIEYFDELVSLFESDRLDPENLNMVVVNLNTDKNTYPFFLDII